MYTNDRDTYLFIWLEHVYEFKVKTSKHSMHEYGLFIRFKTVWSLTSNNFIILLNKKK